MYVEPMVAAAEHRARLQAEAAHYRLVALARCCKPSTWRRALSRLRPAVAPC